MKAPAGEKQAALQHAALVPLETAELSYRLIGLADEIARTGNKNAITDAGVACLLADTAVQGASLNVRINLRYLKDPEAKKVLEAKLALLFDSPEKSRAAMKHIMERLQP
jgi:formiminotetrahydrofolate cyclodeaminase